MRLTVNTKAFRTVSDGNLDESPSFAPNGSMMIYAARAQGRSVLYAVAADGRSLVFTSDRGGSPQIYRVSAAGGEPQRVTFEGKYNARASYSSDGKRLAMVTRDGGEFRIGLLDLATKAFRTVSDGNLDESPSFAPNGSMIIYAARAQGRGVLYAVSADGRTRQRLALDVGDVREPVWSPYSKR